DTYIDWYNTERISTKLKGLSPVQYRDQALAA
ncbi:IS3 family transposase, partial [Mycobacterium sp. DSM 3803]|nr:IS3 family transposase [Mycobacterium sp. DSM 3803]